MANTHSLDLEEASSQYAEITDASQTGLGVTGDFTVECWIKPETLALDTMLVSKWLGAGSQRSFYLELLTTGKIRCAYNSDGGSTNSYSNTDNAVASTGTWVHIAVTVDVSAASFTFYADGVVVPDTNVASDASSMFDGTGAFDIGITNDYTASAYYDGLIEDVRFWDDIRTAQEIVDNMYLELDGTEANLQGYWKLNNGYTDETSNGNDLTASGSPVFSTSVPWTETNSKSLDLEVASGQYASIVDGSQTGLDITGDITIEAWVNVESLSGTRLIVDKWTGSGDQRSYQFGYTSSGLRFDVSSDGTTANSDSISKATTLTTGTWFHVAVAWTASTSTAEFFVDGSSIGSTADTETSIFNGTAAFGIGSNAVSDNWDGLIDEVRIWDVIRTVGQIAAAKDTAIKEDHANLQGCWALDDDYVDETGNNNDLTAVSAPVFSTDVPFPIAEASTSPSANMYIIL
jgi:hypothetical protein